MAKKQKNEYALVVKKNYWSTISIWWAIIVALIAIPVALVVVFAMLDYAPYMEGLKAYAEANGITGVMEAVFNDYQAAVEAGELTAYEDAVSAGAATSQGLFIITSMLVYQMGMSYATLELIKTIAFVAGVVLFGTMLVYLFAKLICAKKTSWTFYDGAVIYKKGRSQEKQIN